MLEDSIKAVSLATQLGSAGHVDGELKVSALLLGGASHRWAGDSELLMGLA